MIYIAVNFVTLLKIVNLEQFHENHHHLGVMHTQAILPLTAE